MNSARPINYDDAAKSLAEVYTRAGLPCEIEHGLNGVIVYASSRDHAARISLDLAHAVRTRDPHVFASPVNEDKDEPEATRYWAAVDFDWRRF